MKTSQRGFGSADVRAGGESSDRRHAEGCVVLGDWCLTWYRRAPRTSFFSVGGMSSSGIRNCGLIEQQNHLCASIFPGILTHFSSRTPLWSRANSGRRDGRMATPPAEESCGTFSRAPLSVAAWSTLASPRRDGGSNRGEPTTSSVATSHPCAFADARCARESTNVDGTLRGNARGHVIRKFVAGSSAENGPPATPVAPAALEAARRGRCSFPSRALTASGRRDENASARYALVNRERAFGASIGVSRLGGSAAGLH